MRQTARIYRHHKAPLMLCNRLLELSWHIQCRRRGCRERRVHVLSQFAETGAKRGATLRHDIVRMSSRDSDVRVTTQLQVNDIFPAYGLGYPRAARFPSLSGYSQADQSLTAANAPMARIGMYLTLVRGGASER